MSKAKKSYIAEREVLGVRSVEGEKTPQGGQIVEVEFKDGNVEKMPDLRYKAVVTEEPSDASSVQDRLLSHVGSTVYGFLHEYDLRMSEVEPLMNQVVTLVNGGSAKATNHLFGVDHSDDRTLLMFNNILLDNYGESENGDDASSSDGEGTSGEDSEQE